MPFVSILARKSSDSIYALYRTEDLHYLIGVDVQQWQKLLDERAAALASDRAWDLDLMPNAHPPMMPQPMISTRPNSATEPVWGAPDSGPGAEAQAGTRRRVQSARSAQSARSRPKSRVVVGAGATVGSVDGATILAMYADMMSSSKEREEAAGEAQAREKAADAADVVKGMVDGGGVVPWGETDESPRATPSYGAAGKAGGRDSAQHAADARRGSQTARPATAPASPRRQPSTVQMGLVPASAALPPQGATSARGALEEASGRHNTAAGTAKRPRSTGVKYFAASGTGRLSGEGYDAGFMDAIRQVAVTRSPPRHPSPPRRSPPRNGYGGTRTTLLRPAGSAPPRGHRSLRMQQRQGRNPETDAESGSSAAHAQPKGPMMWISPRGQDGKVYGGSTADQQRPRTASLAYSQPRDAFPKPGRQERPQTAGVRPASFPAARSPYIASTLTLMTTFAQRHCITLASPVLGRRLSPPIPGVPGARSPPLSLPASPPSHHLLVTPPPTEHINVNARHRSIPGSGPSSAPIMGTAFLATCYCCCCGKPDPARLRAQPVSSPRSRSRKGCSSRAVLRMRPASAVRADGGDSRGRALWTETRIERPCWSAR